jgi:hypothetical protein
MTVAYPDVREMVRQVVQDSNGKITNFIIDSELIAYDIPNERILPF